ncbi:histidyl-tRNA synthetase [Rhizobium sp. BK491]|nr:histidyl-tRNA synthetase [Rhizobium sp. BK491]
MLNIYNVNSLVHWEERGIRLRDDFVRFFSDEVASFLRSTNPAWDIRRVEAPTLMPRNLVSDAYSNSDIWVQKRMSNTEAELVLRPETTPSTYAYMQHLLGNHSRTRLPLCVWQAGKSYRREQDSRANM